MDIAEILKPPLDSDYILRKQRTLKRKLLEADTPRIHKRIAFLCGSTVTDIRSVLELFLLAAGIEPEFFESEYNQYYEDAVFGNDKLDAFGPEIIIIFTSSANLKFPPALTDSPDQAAQKLEREYSRFAQIWDSLAKRCNAVIIQNNMDIPHVQPEGNIILPSGLGRFADSLNEKFAAYSLTHPGFYVHDLHRLCAQTGLSRWHNRNQYYSWKLAVNYDVIPEVSWSLCRVICSVLGRVKKCLVLDLDNTLWGGIIGDDGVNGISIGSETPEGEAFTEFQTYCKALKERGVILAVCSKNDPDAAKSGFTHPDSVLSLEDFAAFHANWDPKNVNIRSIAAELNIGLDSLVFIDDNPAERAIVRETVPEVSVPEVDPDDVFSYIQAIEANGYFDTAGISDDDRRRSETYRQNAQRAELEHSAASYDDFLESLQMEAEVAPFREIYFDRIAQLTNKTNQFNLTTRRFTVADIRAMTESDKFITIYCRLKDRFGDNGIISLVIAERDENNPDELNVILWLMSCRVIRRGVEGLMMNCLMKKAAEAGFKKVNGFYFRTKKNAMVSELYKDFGFTLTSQDGGDTAWEKSTEGYEPVKTFIRITGGEQ